MKEGQGILLFLAMCIQVGDNIPIGYGEEMGTDNLDDTVSSTVN